MNISKLRVASLTLLITFSLVANVSAQVLDKMNVGIGIGIDYGGLGARATYQPIRRLGLFGSAGYNFNAVGYNVGAHVRFPSEKMVDWFLSGMYGYNAVLQISGAQKTRTTYYGPSVGGGIELKMGNSRKSFFSFELIVPFRPQSMDNAIHDLKMLGYTVSKPLPVTFSAGYHIKLK